MRIADTITLAEKEKEELRNEMDLLASQEEIAERPFAFMQRSNFSSLEKAINDLNLQLDGAKKDFSRARVMIAICTNYDFMHARFVQAYLRLIKTEKTTPAFCVNMSRIDRGRCDMAEAALQGNFEYLFFIDADMFPAADTLQRLLEHDKDITGALCFRKSEPYAPCMAMEINGVSKVILEYPKELLNVDYIGTGCLLIKTKVFRNMDKPYFAWARDGMGEDYYFCRKARELGFKIYCDTTLVCDHLVQGFVGEQHFENHKQTDHYKRFLKHCQEKDIALNLKE